MKKYDLTPIRTLLFVFNVENPDSEDSQDLISSKNVNNTDELSELFDLILKQKFLEYHIQDQLECIESLEHYLIANTNCDEILEGPTYFFDDSVENRQAFMSVLLKSLKEYMLNPSGASPKKIL